MPYGYRDSLGDIIGLSDKPRTLAEAQAINPDIASVDSDPPQPDIDAYYARLNLIDAKRRKVMEIDVRTDQLIEEGFTYGGDTFSLSVPSQLKLVGSDAARNDPGFVYPVVWNNIDNTGVVSLADATTLHNFYLLAVSKVREHLDSGTALKNQVSSATTMAELDAVVDNR